MLDKRAAKDLEPAVVAALANAMHRKHRGERVDELSMSAVGVVCLLTLIGVAFDPYPYRWLVPVQIGLPWVSFAFTWYFVDREHQGQHNRFVSLFFSSLFISMVAMVPYGYVSLVSRSSTVVVACVAGLVISGVLTMPALVSRKSRAIATVVMAAVLAFYSYTVLYQLNCLLDRSPVVAYKSVVSATGRLYLGPDILRIRLRSQDSDFATVGVPPKVSHSIQLGETVCVVQRNGALHTPWFTVQTCPWTGELVDLGPAGGMLRALRSLIYRSSQGQQ
jgi:hypothetical protein